MQRVEDLEAKNQKSIVNVNPSGIDQSGKEAPKDKEKGAGHNKLKKAIAHAGKQSSEEIEALECGLVDSIDPYVEYKVNRLAGLVQSVPGRVVSGLAERLEEVKGNPETFHLIGGILGASLLGDRQSDSVA
ncbi:MAG: hypothetical protein EBS38_08545 [Actinobacteria bacterium]|nr:hypothetical protein [Actinomycetota bacterium]